MLIYLSLIEMPEGQEIAADLKHLDSHPLDTISALVKEMIRK